MGADARAAGGDRVSRLAADLVRAEDRIAELEAENETLRGILRKLVDGGAIRMYLSAGHPCLAGDEQGGADLTPTEAALFDTITKETTK